MNLRLFTGLTAIVCLSLASCYPYNEKPRNKKANKGTEKVLTPAEQQKLKEDEARKKAEEELKKKQEEAQKTTPDGTGAVTPPVNGGNGAGAPTTPPKRTDYPVAIKVPGKEDQVFSPYNNRVVLISDEQGRPFPSGTLMQDPTFPPSEKKYFRVP